MLQISLIIILFLSLIIPTGNYLYHIATGQHTFADPLFNKIDNGIYKLTLPEIFINPSFFALYKPMVAAITA